MIGIVECRPSSSMVVCEKVRTARASTYWLITRAKSATLSRTPEADVLAVEEDRVAAELGDRRLEADAGPQRGLVEDQAQGPAGQELRALAVLAVLALQARPRGRAGRRPRRP